MSIGANAGGDGTVAVYGVAIGGGAGEQSQQYAATAVGGQAGQLNQQIGAVALGYAAGYQYQQTGAIAIGSNAGVGDGSGTSNGSIQQQFAIAIGANAGSNAQGEYAIAIGAGAGSVNQLSNSIVLNASGAALNASNAGFYVKPVRTDNFISTLMFYNSDTSEVAYNTNTYFQNSTLTVTGNIFINTLNKPEVSSALIVTGNSTRGGDGYVDVLGIVNNYYPESNVSKWFRLDSNSDFQIINSEYTSNIYNLDDLGNIKIPGTITLKTSLSYQSYSGVQPIFSGTLNANQNGQMIQMIGNITLPLGTSVPSGGKFNFTSASGNTTYTITVNDTGTEFIYNGGNLSVTNRSIAVQPGETLELTSRGSTEWDITGGTAAIRYQTFAPTMGISFPNRSGQASVTYGTLIAYMANGTGGTTAGTLYLATTTGTIDIRGQALWLYFGAGPSAQTMSATLTTTGQKVSGSPATSTVGDMVVATFTDTTNSIFYRVTGQQSSAANTGSYSLIIEKLA